MRGWVSCGRWSGPLSRVGGWGYRYCGHSVAPLDEGCGNESHREVTDSTPLVPEGSNGSEVSMNALVHVSWPGVHVDSEEDV